MEQIKELLDILKETPEMALWGLGIYYLFILLKLSSWVYALSFIAKLLIKRIFDYKEKSLNNKRGIEIAEYFEKHKINNVDYNLFLDLINAIKDGNYIHSSDLKNAIDKIKEK